MDRVERDGVAQRVEVGKMAYTLVIRFAYPDWPGGEVDMQRYIAMIKASYSSLRGFIDTEKITYKDFITAIGCWATGDHSVEPAITMFCQIAFLATQWTTPADEPSDQELILAAAAD